MFWSGGGFEGKGIEVEWTRRGEKRRDETKSLDLEGVSSLLWSSGIGLSLRPWDLVVYGRAAREKSSGPLNSATAGRVWSHSPFEIPLVEADLRVDGTMQD